MKNFEPMFRAAMILLAVIALGAVWRAAAQTQTNQSAHPAIAATNTAAGTGVVTNVPGGDEDVITRDLESPPWVTRLARHWPFLQHPFLGNQLWKYLCSLVYIFLAFYVSKFLDFLTRVWLKKWAERTETKFDDLLLDLLNGPVRIISFVVFLRIGLDVFSWPPLVQSWLNRGFTIVVAGTVTYTLLKLVDMLMGYWHLRIKADADKEFHDQIFPIIRKTLKLFVVAVAVLVTLDNIGVNITAAIASLSIGGLAVGLAAQDTLGNLFGAVAIFLDRPFRVGDYISLDTGAAGTVETVGVRSTKVRSLDGYVVNIPNKTMASAAITNITRRPSIKTTMNIGLTYDTPAEKIKRALAILEEIYRGHPKTADVWISFNQFADSSLNLVVIHWWNATVYKEYLAGMQELNLEIKERFDAEGLNFAFPSRTVYLKQDSEWRVSSK